MDTARGPKNVTLKQHLIYVFLFAHKRVSIDKYDNYLLGSSNAHTFMLQINRTELQHHQYC